MSQSPTQASVQARAVAAPGLLARLAVVVNPHPVSAFHYTELRDGTAIITIGLAPDPTARDEWHVERVVARLSRVIGVISIETRYEPHQV